MYRVGDIIAGEYVVSHVFTNGGMGVVYKVHRSGWDVDMAMKCPRAELFENDVQRKEFIRECETWMKLGSHPNIISCYYIKNIDSVPSVLMEYAEGGSLLDHISSGRLYEGSPQEVLGRLLDFAIQTARGLFHAHQKGFVHQDVKPANVLVTASGVAKVSDFGLSKAKSVMRKSALMANGQSLVVSSGGWTPAYGSPEQALGRPLTKRTDIWSWAVMILEMIHGKLFWKAGPLAARALQQLWPWQIFSPKVKTSRGLVKILRECLEEREEKRPKDFDVVEKKLLALYRDVIGEAYPRWLPASMLTAEATLCNRIASHAELEANGGDYFSEVYGSLIELHSISPWAVWGDLNYAAYCHLHGMSVERIRRAITNLLRRANTDQEKEWLLNLLISLGLSSARDPMVKLLRITENKRLMDKILRVHESVRNRLDDVFADEPIRHAASDEFDINRYNCGYGVSESATVHVRAERTSTDGDGCSVRLMVTVDGKVYEITEEILPEDSRIEYITCDDRGVKISLWIWIPNRGLYQKVFGVEKEKLVSYRCDFRKREDWGVDAFDVPRGIYLTGDARLLMLRYKRDICSIWLNEKGDAGDGRNVCIVQLRDYGLIPPEILLPGMRLQYGFEYGLSDDTAYRLMRTLEHIYGSILLPCHVARPESSERELERSQRGTSLLRDAARALELGNKRQLVDLVSGVLLLGVLPDERLLSARHAEVMKSSGIVVKTCWHAQTMDEYWENPISALYSYGDNAFQATSFGCSPRQFEFKEKGLTARRFPFSFDPIDDLPNLHEPSFIAVSGCDNGDMIVACCSGWDVSCIKRVSKVDGGVQKTIWHSVISKEVMRSGVLQAHQTDRSISFDESHGRISFIDKKDGALRTLQCKGCVRFWTDNFTDDSPLSVVIVSDCEVLALDQNAETSPLSVRIKQQARSGIVRGLSHDGRSMLIQEEWNVKVCDLTTGKSNVIYAVDPYSLNNHGLGGALALLCSLSPDGKAMAIVTMDRRLKIFDVTTRKEVFEWSLGEGKFGPMAFDRSGRWLILIRDEKKIEVFQLFWDLTRDTKS